MERFNEENDPDNNTKIGKLVLTKELALNPT